MGSGYLRCLAKDWLPPAATRFLQQLRGGGIRFKGEFATWEEAAARCTGYDAEHILEKVLDATLKVKRGEAAFERDSVLFDEIEYAWPVTAGLMWAAARSGGRLNVLDFGGALGSSYFQNRKLLDSLRDVSWSVIEQPHYVQAGQALIQDARLRFYDSIELCFQENQPNVVLFSSVLEYIQSSDQLIESIQIPSVKMLIIDRTPFSNRASDLITTQLVDPRFFHATLPCRILSKSRTQVEIESKGYHSISWHKTLGPKRKDYAYACLIAIR